MPEVKLETNPMFPDLPVREDLEIYHDDEGHCYRIKDKATKNVLCEVPSQYPPQPKE